MPVFVLFCFVSFRFVLFFFPVFFCLSRFYCFFSAHRVRVTREERSAGIGRALSIRRYRHEWGQQTQRQPFFFLGGRSQLVVELHHFVRGGRTFLLRTTSGMIVSTYSSVRGKAPARQLLHGTPIGVSGNGYTTGN